MEVKSVGVDWLTMTTKESSVGQNWYDVYRKYKAIRMQEGNKEKPFNNGFYGGVKTAKMSVGYSDAIGYIVIVSGRDAERLFQRLQPGKKRVTRLDLCIDFLFDRRVDLADMLFTKLSGEAGGKQRRYSLFSNSDDGKTFYLGSRQSTQYGRVYDKGIESNRETVGRLWRAEIEYKKPISGHIAESLAKIRGEERVLAICDTVTEWFGDRNSELFPRGMEKHALHISVEQRITTADKKLAWLRSQVSPTVIDLIGAGYGKSVLEVLGLDIKTISECLQARY